MYWALAIVGFVIGWVANGIVTDYIKTQNELKKLKKGLDKKHG